MSLFLTYEEKFTSVHEIIDANKSLFEQKSEEEEIIDNSNSNEVNRL